MTATKILLLGAALAMLLPAGANAQRAAQRNMEADRDAELRRQELEVEADLRRREIELEARMAEQELELAREAQQQQSQGELQARQQEMELVQREVQRQQEELVLAREELERARAEMERAARQMARVSTAPRLAPVRAQNYTVALGGARIGANIQNAEGGALVLAVTPGGPAAEAGILSGDLITEINGTAIADGSERGVQTVVETLAGMESGTTVPIVLTRAGEAMTFMVETADFPGDFTIFERFPGMRDFDVNIRDIPNRVYSVMPNIARYIDRVDFFGTRWHEMELIALTEELGAYFDTDEGLLIVRAPETEDLDLHDGDVILSISGRAPTSPEHAMRILSSFVPGESLEFSIMRMGRRRTVEFTVPDPEAAEDD